MDEYIKSDEQKKSDIQKMYFDGCEIEYNESTGEEFDHFAEFMITKEIKRYLRID